MPSAAEYQKNKEHYLAKDRERRDSRKAYFKAYNAKLYRENKDAMIAKNKAWRADHPWYDCWRNAWKRCTDPNHKSFAGYSAKGIEFKLTQDEAKYLYVRDNAHLLETPSIDRIDPAGHYELDNCRFMELVDNVARAKLPHVEETTEWVD